MFCHFKNMCVVSQYGRRFKNKNNDSQKNPKVSPRHE
jgi:hypothetical protein